MIIKNCLFVFFCLLYSSEIIPITLHPGHYRNEAQAWVKKFISAPAITPLSPQDLQICANLFYFSYLRSAATLKTQDITHQTLLLMWEGWQNVAQTRMNPSIELPYPQEYLLQENLYSEFVKAQSYHHKLGKTYAHAAQVALKGNMLSSASKHAVTKLRDRSREIVTLAFTDAKKIIGNLIDFASSTLRSDWIEWDDFDDQEPHRFDIIDSISSYLPYFSIQSFIELERINTQASEQTWNILFTLFKVNKQIWEIIEIERASFYLAHYQELYISMNNYSVDQRYFHILFNENGIISTADQNFYLPHLQVVESL